MRHLLNLRALSFALLLVVSSLTPFSAEAKHCRDCDRNRERGGSIAAPLQAQSQAQNDSDLVRAVNDRRSVHFVEAANVVVTRILPDDTSGLPHQRWYVRLSNGTQVLCVYNLNMGNKIPLQMGSTLTIGGEFKWTSQGPLMHWLHDDPKDRRPDGYVEMNGVRYGQ